MKLLEASHIAIQTAGWINRQFTFLDEEGHVLGQGVNLSDGLTNFFVGSRSFEIREASGEMVCQLQDVMSFGLDKFEIRHGGQLLAVVTHKLSFLGEKFDVSMPGAQLQVSGSILDTQLQFLRPDGSVCARAGRTFEWLTITGCRYALDISPEATDQERRAVIGTTVAYGLHRLKKQRNNG